MATEATEDDDVFHLEDMIVKKDLEEKNEKVAESHTPELQLEDLKGRLYRRNEMIEALRRAYYRDVITIKQQLVRKENDPEGYIPDDQLEGIPSPDLRNTLPLFSPSNTYLHIHPCKECGGTVELIHSEVQVVAELRAELGAMQKSENQMKTILHRLRTEAEKNSIIIQDLEHNAKRMQKENGHLIEKMKEALANEKKGKAVKIELKSVQNKLKATEDQLQQTQQQLNELLPELEAVSQQKEMLEQVQERLENEVKTSKGILRKEREEKRSIDKNYNETKKKLSLSQAVDEEQQIRIQKIEKNMQLLSESEDRKTLSLIQMTEKATELQKQYDASKRHHEESIQSEEAAQEALRDKLAALKKEMRKMEKESKEIMIEHKKSSSKVQEIETERDEWKEKYCAEITSREDAENIHAAQLHDYEQAIDRLRMIQNDLQGKVLTVQQQYVDFRQRVLTGETSETEQDSEISSDDDDLIEDENVSSLSFGATQRAVNFISRTREQRRRRATRLLIMQEELSQLRANLEFDAKKNQELAESQDGLKKELEDLKVSEKALREMNEGYQKILDQLESADNGPVKLQKKIVALEKSVVRQERKSKGLTEILESMLEHWARDCVQQVSRDQLLAPVTQPTKSPKKKDKAFKGFQTLSEDAKKKREEIKREMQLDQDIDMAIKYWDTKSHLMERERQKVLKQVEKTENDLNGLCTTLNQEKADHLKTRNLLKMESDRLKDEQLRSQKLQENAKLLTAESVRLNRTMKATENKMKAITSQRNNMNEEKARLTTALSERKKSIDGLREIIDKHTKTMSDLRRQIDATEIAREGVEKRIQDMIDVDTKRLATNVSVSISVCPSTCDTEMQTDRWRPVNLVMAQRNSPKKTPHRYNAKPTMTISNGSDDTLPMHIQRNRVIPRPQTSMAALSEETVRQLPQVQTSRRGYLRWLEDENNNSQLG